MPIRIDPAVRRAAYERKGTLVIQVAEASDIDSAADALRNSIHDLIALDGGPDSAPGLGPDDTNTPHSIDVFATSETGPVILIDPGFTPRDLLLKIPGILVSHLEQAGVKEGRLVLPPWEGPFDEVLRVDGFPTRFPTARVALVVAFPAIDESDSISASWLDEAVAWLTLEPAASDLSAHVSHLVHVTIPRGGARSLLERGNGADLNIQLALRRTGGVVATVTLAPIPWRPRLVLAAGDPSGKADMSALFESAMATARRLAPQAAYTYVTVEDSFQGVSHSSHHGDVTGNMASPEYVADLADELVLDAFPFQVLSEGHLAKLGGAPEGAEELDAGRVGLSIGELSAWLSPKRRVRRTLLKNGRGLLLPCITTNGEAFAMIRARLDQRR